MVEGLKVWVTLTQIMRLRGFISANAVQQKTHRVAVPGRYIQICTQVIMIKGGDTAHEIMNDGTIRIFANFVTLYAIEQHDLIG